MPESHPQVTPAETSKPSGGLDGGTPHRPSPKRRQLPRIHSGLDSNTPKPTKKKGLRAAVKKLNAVMALTKVTAEKNGALTKPDATSSLSETREKSGSRVLMTEVMYDNMIQSQSMEHNHEAMVNLFKLRRTAMAQQGDGGWIAKALSNRRLLFKLAPGSRPPAGGWSHAGRVALLITTLAEEQDLLTDSLGGKTREELILRVLRRHAFSLVRHVEDHRQVAIEILRLRARVEEECNAMTEFSDESKFPCNTEAEVIAQLKDLAAFEESEGWNRAVAKCVRENRWRAESGKSQSFLQQRGLIDAMVLHPEGACVTCWAWVVECVVYSQLVLIPHNLSFRSSESFAIVDWFTDAVLLLDIVIQCHTAFKRHPARTEKPPLDTKIAGSSRRVVANGVANKGGGVSADGGKAVVLVWNRWKILTNYAKRCGFVDTIALAPRAAALRRCFLVHGWTLVSLAGRCSTVTSPLKILRLVKLLKIFSFFQVHHTSKKKKDRENWLLNYSRYANATNLCLVMLLLLCTMHFLACGWHSVTARRHWVQRYSQYRSTQGDDDQVPYSDIPMRWLYIMALYESVLVLMGEEINIQRDGELIFVIVAVVLCSVLVAIVFGQVGLLISNMNEQQRAFNRKMFQLYEAMSQSELPGILQERVSAYYAYLWKEHRTYDGRVRIAQFLPELPPNLAKEVQLFWCSDMIRKVPFFRLYPFQVVQRLIQAIDIELYMPDDYIVLIGEVGHEMFFIKSGTVDVFRVDKTEVELTTKEELGQKKNEGRFGRRTTRAFIQKRQGRNSRTPTVQGDQAHTNGALHAKGASMFSSIEMGFRRSVRRSVKQIRRSLLSVQTDDADDSDDDDSDDSDDSDDGRPSSSVPVDSDANDPAADTTADASPRTKAAAAAADDDTVFPETKGDDHRQKVKNQLPPRDRTSFQHVRKPTSTRRSLGAWSASVSSRTRSTFDVKKEAFVPRARKLSQQSRTSLLRRNLARTKIAPATNHTPDAKTPAAAEEKSPSRPKRIQREQLVCTLHEGEYFGDVALLTQCRRTATVKARTFVTCSIIRREAFEQMLGDYPEMWVKTTEMLKARYGRQLSTTRQGKILQNAFEQAELNKLGGDVISDPDSNGALRLVDKDKQDSEKLTRRLSVLESRIKFLDRDFKLRLRSTVGECVKIATTPGDSSAPS